MFIFKLIVLVYFLLNAWIVWWFWRALKGGKSWLRFLACFLLILLTVAYPVMMRFGGSGPVLMAGAIWAGVFFYVAIMVLIAEITGIPKRRQDKSCFFIKPKPRYAAVITIIIVTGLAAFFSWKNASTLRLNEVDLVIKTDRKGYLNLPDHSIKIGLVSDIHLGCLVSVERLEEVMNLLQPREPDILLFLGDVLDDHVCLDREKMKTLISGMRPKYGTWGVLGNHEYKAGRLSNGMGANSLEILENSGIRILRDQSVVVGDSLLLAGWDDHRYGGIAGKGRRSLAEILSQAPEGGREMPVLLMDHQPYNLEEAEQEGVALELSGHTHYGQIWPFHLIIKSIYENPVGLYRRGNTHYYVSSGAGTWGPPIRNTSFTEVVILNVKFEALREEEGHQ